MRMICTRSSASKKFVHHNDGWSGTSRTSIQTFPAKALGDDRSFPMRNRLISALVACATMVIMGGSLNALQNNDAKWIDRLKSTPLSQMDSSLSSRLFSDWFDQHTKGAEVRYMIEACDSSANTESLKKGTYACVTTTAVRNLASETVMRFLVTADQGTESSQGQYACKFVIGTAGPPPGSPIKKMTRVFRTLPEMITFMGGE